jgi:hypothetical protein
MSSVKPNNEAVEPQWCKDQHGVDHFLAKTNRNFETYYSAQGVCESDEEWAECLMAMRRPLPQSFRINSARLKTAPQLVKLLKDYSSNKKILSKNISKIKHKL